MVRETALQTREALADDGEGREQEPWDCLRRAVGEKTADDDARGSNSVRRSEPEHGPEKA